MTEQHPITPPPELRQLWAQEAQRISPHDPVEWMQYVSEKASQWGANTELKACCEWVETDLYSGYGIPHEQLRAARRPKPPTLAEQGMRILTENGTTLDGRIELDPEDIKTFHAVLVRLQQLEDS
jgi:hypothetical protein